MRMSPHEFRDDADAEQHLVRHLQRMLLVCYYQVSCRLGTACPQKRQHVQGLTMPYLKKGTVGRFPQGQWITFVTSVIFASLMSRACFVRQFSAVLTAGGVSAILLDHELRAIPDDGGRQEMQRKEGAHNDSEGGREIAAPAAAHEEVTPLAQTSSSVPRQRLTTREIARRRRQRLLELLQHQRKPPAS